MRFIKIGGIWYNFCPTADQKIPGVDRLTPLGRLDKRLVSIIGPQY